MCSCAGRRAYWLTTIDTRKQKSITHFFISLYPAFFFFFGRTYFIFHSTSIIFFAVAARREIVMKCATWLTLVVAMCVFFFILYFPSLPPNLFYKFRVGVWGVWCWPCASERYHPANITSICFRCVFADPSTSSPLDPHERRTYAELMIGIEFNEVKKSWLRRDELLCIIQ